MYTVIYSEQIVMYRVRAVFVAQFQNLIDTHNHDIVARVQELVDTDPSKSMRAMARELEFAK